MFCFVVALIHYCVFMYWHCLSALVFDSNSQRVSPVCGLSGDDAHIHKRWTARVLAYGMGVLFVSCCNQATCFANFFLFLQKAVCPVSIKIFKKQNLYKFNMNFNWISHKYSTNKITSKSKI